MAAAATCTDGEGNGDIQEEEEDNVPDLPYLPRKVWMPAIIPIEDFSVCECLHIEWDGCLSVSTEDQLEKKRLISLVLETKYTNSVAGPMDKDWMVGEACIANFNLDKKWYRAEVHIVKRHKKKVWVHFVDYGSFSWCHQKNLRRKLFTMELPIQSVTLKMEGVVPLNSMQ